MKNLQTSAISFEIPLTKFANSTPTQNLLTLTISCQKIKRPVIKLLSIKCDAILDTMSDFYIYGPPQLVTHLTSLIKLYISHGTAHQNLFSLETEMRKFIMNREKIREGLTCQVEGIVVKMILFLKIVKSNTRMIDM